MENKLELKDLWNAQESVVPNESLIISKAMKLKRKIRLHTSLGILSLILTIAIISWVWLSFDFQLLSTKIGISYVLIAIVLGILNAMRTLFAASNNKESKNTREYLENMLIIKDQQLFTQTAFMSAYFFLLSLGLIFYMYEPASNMSTGVGIAAYAITISWLALNWFYWRPKIIKKQRREMDETIAKLRSLADELSD